MKPKTRRRKKAPSPKSHLRMICAVLGVAVLSVIVYAPRAFEPATAPAYGRSLVTFTDAHREAVEFISYNDSIVLTATQKAVMNEALSSIPAPCCDHYSIASCCCPCNLAKSTWGLSKSLITKRHADAAAVRATAVAWLQYVNPHGYTGDACATGGCNRSFEHNGCGGMNSARVQ